MTRFRVEVRSGTTWPSPQVHDTELETRIPRARQKLLKKFS